MDLSPKQEALDLEPQVNKQLSTMQNSCVVVTKCLTVNGRYLRTVIKKYLQTESSRT